jgi:hypothetical protein
MGKQLKDAPLGQTPALLTNMNTLEKLAKDKHPSLVSSFINCSNNFFNIEIVIKLFFFPTGNEVK